MLTRFRKSIPLVKKCYLRSLLNIQVKGVANSSLLGTLSRCLHKFVINVFLHKCARAGTAALTL